MSVPAGPESLHAENNFYIWAGRCSGPSEDLGLNAWCQPNPAAAATCAAQTGGALGCQVCSAENGPCEVNVFGGNEITTIWDWVNQVNAAVFAGHTDWRIPTVELDGDPVELETMLFGWPTPSCGATPDGIPCVDPIFGPTLAGPYWSATTRADSNSFARYLNFDTGLIDAPFPFTKEGGAGIRAVRTLAD